MDEKRTLHVSFDLTPLWTMNTSGGSGLATRFYLFDRETKEELGQFRINEVLPHCGYVAKVERHDHYVTRLELFEVLEDGRDTMVVRSLKVYEGNILTLLDNELQTHFGRPLTPMLLKLHAICGC